MFKVLLNKEKRDQVKEYVEVTFAVLTIAAFAKSQLEKRKAAKEEEEDS